MSIPNGGWLPYCESHPMIRNESPKLYADIQQEYISVGRVKIIDSLKGFLIGQSGGTLINLPQYIYSNNVGSGVITRDYISTITIENMVPWISYSTGFITTRNTSSGKTGNSGCYLQNRIIDSSIPAAKNGTCWVNAAQISIIGSIGYGVGGSSFGFSRNYDTNIEWGGFSGNTGDIVKTTIVLQDTAPIAVSVGCGDGSAGYVSNKSTGLNGNNGTSSAGGASNGQSSSASGFCNGVSSDYISGGGVNGCVAIWF